MNITEKYTVQEFYGAGVVVLEVVLVEVVLVEVVLVEVVVVLVEVTTCVTQLSQVYSVTNIFELLEAKTCTSPVHTGFFDSQ